MDCVMDAILPLLRCVDCDGGGLVLLGSCEGARCPSCGRDYPLDEHRILRMMPQKSLPRPAIYDDPDYKKFMECYEKDAAAVYYSEQNRLFHAVHHAAHKTLKRFSDGHGFSGWELDLGCGTGDHLGYFDDPSRVVGLDTSHGSLVAARKRYPGVFLIQGDAYKLPFKDNTFARVFSIHNLEHIYYLDAALSEVARTLAGRGRFYVGLPAEGGLAWNLGRKISTERIYSKKYGVDYGRVMQVDHCNTAGKVIAALESYFVLRRRKLFPFTFIPVISINLVISAEYGLKGEDGRDA